MQQFVYDFTSSQRHLEKSFQLLHFMAIKERLTCIITIETVMRVIHCRKYHLHNCNRDSICIITTKIVTTHTFAAETVTCMHAAESSS